MNVPLAFLTSFHGMVAAFNVESAPSAIAVSYTHLRAHETLMNLVCRLLLEKKNFFNVTATTGIYT